MRSSTNILLCRYLIIFVSFARIADFVRLLHKKCFCFRKINKTNYLFDKSSEDTSARFNTERCIFFSLLTSLFTMFIINYCFRKEFCKIFFLSKCILHQIWHSYMKYTINVKTNLNDFSMYIYIYIRYINNTR